MSLSQKVEFNEKGFNIIKIGSNFTDLKELNLRSIDSHENKNQIHPLPDPMFSFYYIPIKSPVFFDNSIKYFFVAIDNYTSKVSGLFLEISTVKDSLIKEINNTFGLPSLQSKSSVQANSFSEKVLWSKNEIVVIVSKNSYLNSLKISITSSIKSENDKIPYISVY